MFCSNKKYGPTVVNVISGWPNLMSHIFLSHFLPRVRGSKYYYERWCASSGESDKFYRKKMD
jgi:hypothetical protein